MGNDSLSAQGPQINVNGIARHWVDGAGLYGVAKDKRLFFLHLVMRVMIAFWETL